ncbi:DUF3298 and DUF4163 domain-containing protein [Salinimicrobium sediminilitoris]|uniref:DUF3298 and DUF4163 domain-containing protein n=1 Tax=Salinimicrobium sediminilitoris TaxID=2876715 RepID=UPI001E502540|nr:DUF3298 and DUF4163 domain-containing protein [Salinimicrobium sediminilitoris]MCC8359375.1 DUF3298 and DUF4163 domain-containing protein [Salinimicrobium sediminilitoris]
MSRKVLCLLLLVIVFSSCKKDKEEEKKEETPVSLRFEKESLVKKAGENCDTADYDCSIIALDVVRAAGASEVSKKINRNLDEHIIRLISTQENPAILTLEELSEKFLADYREAAENFSEEPPWEAYVDEKVYLLSDSLVSFGITTEIFSGGAHGYKTLTFLNFDPTSGKILSKQDIFEKDFISFVEEKFRKEQGIPEDENINSTGFWFKNETFNLPENIGFSNDKVVLVYNSYEIAPYAAGDIVMEIPLEEVRPFIRIE